MRLWHDDMRKAPPGWVWAKSNYEASQILLHEKVDRISMDHDMGYETGYELVLWMINNDKVPQSVTIHSWNPSGATRMMNALKDAGYNCKMIPYRKKKDAVD